MTAFVIAARMRATQRVLSGLRPVFSAKPGRYSRARRERAVARFEACGKLGRPKKTAWQEKRQLVFGWEGGAL